MPKYLIERKMPGAGSLSEAELAVLSEQSCIALAKLGPDVQWLESFITQDGIYSVYVARNEQMIRDHATLSGLPADSIWQVLAVMDPSTALRAHWGEEHDVSKESGIY